MVFNQQSSRPQLFPLMEEVQVEAMMRLEVANPPAEVVCGGRVLDPKDGRGEVNVFDEDLEEPIRGDHQDGVADTDAVRSLKLSPTADED